MRITVPKLATAALFAATVSACAVQPPEPEAVFVPTQLIVEAAPQKLPAVPKLPDLSLDVTVVAYNIVPRARPGSIIAPDFAMAEAPLDLENGVGGPEIPIPVPAPVKSFDARPRLKPARPEPMHIEELMPAPSLRRI